MNKRRIKRAIQILRGKSTNFLSSKFEDLETEIVTPDRPVFGLNFWDKKVDPSLPIGYCWLQDSEDHEVCNIIFIYVREEYRRCGYGKKIIEKIKSKYEEVFTQFNQFMINSPGSRLLLSCGFKMRSSIHKKKPGEIVWKRK